MACVAMPSGGGGCPLRKRRGRAQRRDIKWEERRQKGERKKKMGVAFLSPSFLSAALCLLAVDAGRSPFVAAVCGGRKEARAGA